MDSTSYEEIVYEGYGPAGVAVIVETMTDNRNRTAGDIRHYFDKFGGNLDNQGVYHLCLIKRCFSYRKTDGMDEDEISLEAIESGADDINIEDEYIEILTKQEDFYSVKDILEKNINLSRQSSS